MLEVIILSIVQGITEFLPVSSSSHLILVSKFFSFNNESLTLDVSLHLGSLIAIIFYFRKDLLNFINNRVLFLKILISSIPVIIFGFLLIKLQLLDYLRNYKVIGWATIVFGVLLYLSDLIKVKKKFKSNFKFSTSLYIGLFQVLYLIPGVSRSGITITAARLFKFNRVDSAKISFLISIPILSAASLYNIKNLFITSSYQISLINILGVLFSFVCSYLTIKYFLYYISKFSLTVFVIYRIFLGSIILIYSYL